MRYVMATFKKLVEEKIPVGDLIEGMYVSNLDRPWTETPFLLQGFRINKLDDVNKLADYCEYVYIDREKSFNLKRERGGVSENEHVREVKDLKTAGINHSVFRDWKSRYCQQKYKITTSFKNELKSAKKVLDNVFNDIQKLLSNKSRITPTQISNLSEIAHDMTESVLRNPDAMAWLCRIRDFRSPIYLHGIRLSVWGCICGRQLGLNRPELHRLTTALMMSCIGKSFLAKNVLNQYSMTSCPEAYQKHLTLTENHLKSFKYTSNHTLSVIKRYCERIDGSGYPNGLKGNDIPFLSQVAGLVESFELAVNPFDMGKAISPAEAIVQINQLKGELFDSELVEEFVKAIGIYPTGTIVELNDTRLGIISSQSYEMRLRANVIVVTKNEKDKHDAELIELGKDNTPTVEEKPLCIKRGLSANAINKDTLLDAHHHIFEKRSGFWNILRHKTA